MGGLIRLAICVIVIAGSVALDRRFIRKGNQ